MFKLRVRFVIYILLSILAITPCYAMSQEDEIALGRKAAALVEKKYGTIRDEAMVKRARRIGNRIAAQATRDLTYRFGVLNCKDVNAVSFPGGYIYFTKGILNYMDDDLMYFVAGHEIAHVEHKDSINALEKKQAEKIGVAVLQIFVKETRTGAANALFNMTNTIINNRYSQGAEFAADATGMELMAKAGCDPYKAIDALQALKKASGKDMNGFLNSLLSTHPITDDRIKRARVIAPKLDPERKLRSKYDEYQQIDTDDAKTVTPEDKSSGSSAPISSSDANSKEDAPPPSDALDIAPENTTNSKNESKFRLSERILQPTQRIKSKRQM